MSATPVKPKGRLRRRFEENGLVILFALLIALCVIYAPIEMIRFIYAEF